MIDFKRLFLLLLGFAGIALLMSSCKSKERSRTTGMEYNNPDNYRSRACID